jgi:hypothetical protein
VGTLDFDHQVKQSTKSIGCAMTATRVQASAEQNSKKDVVGDESGCDLTVSLRLAGDANQRYYEPEILRTKDITNELAAAHITVQRSTADLLSNTWDQEEK